MWIIMNSTNIQLIFTEWNKDAMSKWRDVNEICEYEVKW